MLRKLCIKVGGDLLGVYHLYVAISKSVAGVEKRQSYRTCRALSHFHNRKRFIRDGSRPPGNGEMHLQGKL